MTTQPQPAKVGIRLQRYIPCEWTDCTHEARSPLGLMDRLHTAHGCTGMTLYTDRHAIYRNGAPWVTFQVKEREVGNAD